MKKLFPFVILFVVFHFFTIEQAVSQIQSTAAGGNWNQTTTWIGGVVPGAGDDVIIAGHVNVNGNFSCNDLDVLTCGILQNSGASHSLNISGSVQNYGIIRNNQSHLTLNVKGDILISGVWSNYATNLEKIGDQYITLATGHIYASEWLNKTEPGNVIANTDLTLSGTKMNFDNNTLILPDNGTLSNDGLGSNSLVTNIHISGNNITINFYNGIYVQNFYATGPTIEGLFKIGNNTVYLSGTTTVNGIIENYGSTHTIYFEGNVINNGIIRNGISYLNIYISGDMTDNGEWSNYQTMLNGIPTQNITFGEGVVFTGTKFEKMNSSPVVTHSDIHFINTEFNFNFANITLEPGSYFSMIGQNDRCYKINFIGNNSILEVRGVYLQQVSGVDLTFRGTVQIGDNDCEFTNIYLLDTLQNYGSSHSVDFFGDFKSDGVIQNGQTDLTVNLFGDIWNNGKWMNNSTMLKGDVSTTQNITFGEGVVFTGNKFENFNGSPVVTHSDIHFINTEFNFNFANVTLEPGSCFSMIGGGTKYCKKINFIGNNSILEVRGVYLQQVSGVDLTFRGTVLIGDSYCEFTNIYLLDTLQNYSSSHSVDFFGDFKSVGVIQNGQTNLTVNLFGDVWNYGEWYNNTTNFYGTTSQNLTFSPGNVFRGELIYSFTDTIFVHSDLSFYNTKIDFNYNKMVMPDNSSLTIGNSGKYFREATILGEDLKIICDEGSYISGTTFTGNAQVFGTVGIGSHDCIFLKDLTVIDTLANCGSGHTLNIFGNLYNYGSILNLVTTLKLIVAGDIFNAGELVCNENNLDNTTDQNIRLIDNAGIYTKTILKSNLGGWGFQWYHNGAPISGATGSNLTLNQVENADYGIYYCTSSSEETSRIFTIQRALKADFTSDAPEVGSAPLTVSFTDQSISGFPITSWLWKFGDGCATLLQNPVHEYTDPGHYDVSLTIGDSYHSDMVIKYDHVFVCTNPEPDFDFDDVCDGSPVFFTDLSTDVNLKDSMYFQYATVLIDFSSEWGEVDWGAIQTLGEPDVYPAYCDSPKAWAPLMPNGPREFIELGYDEPMPINAVWIYENLKPGAVDTVYVKNPTTGNWEIVWFGTAEPMPEVATINKIEFPTTIFNVSEIRIAMNTGAVSYWSEIDAVAIVSPKGEVATDETVYEWDVNNDGTIDYFTKGDISHLYPGPGFYEAKLHIINNGVCEGEIIKTVVVNSIPEIIEQPVGLTVCVGDSAIFSVEATYIGNFGIYYQWIGPLGIIPGATENELLIYPVTVEDAGEYCVVVENQCGNEISDKVELIVNTPPEIISQPEDKLVCEGETVVFSVDVSGTEPLEYQWYGPEGLLEGENQSSLTLDNITVDDSGNYYVEIVNMCGMASSENALLTVQPLPEAFAGENATICEDENYELSDATAEHYSQLLWSTSGTGNFDDPEILNPVYTPDQEDINNGFVDLTITAQAKEPCTGEIFSTMTLSFEYLPEIIEQPENQEVCEEGSVQFDVLATGSEPISYQWYGPEGEIMGATLDYLILENVTPEDGGSYYCKVSNNCNIIQSDAATLTVFPLPSFDVQPESLQIPTCGDAIFSVEVSGAQPVSLQWYGPEGLLDGETGTELIIEKVNMLNAGEYYCVAENFCGNTTSEVAILTVLSGGVSQNIELLAGWSGVSSYLYFDNPLVEEIFAPVFSDLVIFLDDEKMYWPAGGINTMHDWNNHQGYKIKVSDNVTLNLSGCVESDKLVELDEGWNIIPVLNECDNNVEELFSGIVSELVIVKEVAGWRVYWPGLGINNLEVLSSGLAYYVLMTSNASVEFPVCDAVNFTQSKYPKNIKNNSFWNEPIITAGSHIFAIPGEVITATGLQEGDIIGGFTNEGVCAGITEINLVNSENSISLTLFENDITTQEKEGFNDGENILFKLFRHANNQEYELTTEFDTHWPAHNGTYAGNGLSVISGLKTGASIVPETGLANIRIYPNPAKDIIVVSGLECPEANISLFDIEGRLILKKTVFNTINEINVSDFENGVYLLKIISDKGIIVKRIVIKH